MLLKWEVVKRRKEIVLEKEYLERVLGLAA